MTTPNQRSRAQRSGIAIKPRPTSVARNAFGAAPALLATSMHTTTPKALALCETTTQRRTRLSSQRTLAHCAAASSGQPAAGYGRPMTDDASRLFVGGHPLQSENMERNGPMLERLADRLLPLGGETVVVPFDSPALVAAELRRLLRSGQAFDAQSATLEQGEPSDCHVNSVNLWRVGRGAICTGYALSGREVALALLGA
jgi:hypothetical protein